MESRRSVNKRFLKPMPRSRNLGITSYSSDVPEALRSGLCMPASMPMESTAVRPDLEAARQQELRQFYDEIAFGVGTERKQGQHSMRHQYSYSPLETRTTIRLLMLDPGTLLDPLRGEMRHVELDHPEYQAFDPTSMIRSSQEPTSANVPRYVADAKHPSYEALSYVWGFLQYTAELVTKEGSIKITPSLDGALRRLRLDDRVRVLWADGVCINQNDTTERGHQVKLMGSIFQKAFRVLIWLGPTYSLQATVTFEVFRSPCSSHELNEAVARLIEECQWFQRMWVVQEAYLGKTSIVLWGPEEMNFQKICQAAWTMRHNLSPKISWILRVFQSRFQNLDFVDLLSRTRHLKCLDDRDRVYALLGLPYEDPAIVEDITPDYTTSVYDVYYRVACSIVKAGRGPDLFMLVLHHSSLPQWPTNLPSWVPDLPEPPALSFQNTAQCTVRDSCTMSVDFEHRAVITQGILLDQIVAVSAPLINHRGDHDESAISKFWESHIQGMPWVTTNYSMSLAMCEALMCHQVWREKVDVLDRSVRSARIFLGSCCPGTQQPFVPKNNIGGDVRGPRPQSLDVVDDMKDAIQKDLSHLRADAAHLPFLSQSSSRYEKLWKGRKLFTSGNQFVGLGPEAMNKGDFVVFLDGSGMPFILRSQDGFYQLVGAAYIPGLMPGDEPETLKHMHAFRKTFEIR